jgi:hypothetical protein
MRRLALTTAVAVGLFALACTDERQEGPTEPASTAAAAKPCTGSLDQIQTQICALFPPTDLLKSASDFYNNIKTKLTKDPAFAKARAVDLVNFTFKQYYAGKLQDPSGPQTTQQGVVNLTCLTLGYVGSGWTDCATDLGAGLGTTTSGPHSTIQVCGPAGCLVRPADKHSGVSVPPGACPTLCIISVDPIPPNQGSPRDGPLSFLTNLDQYPLFRELKLVASFNEFSVPVIVGICHLNASDGGPFAPPDDATEARLRLAHPDPNNSEQIEILEKVAAPFLDCSDLFASNDEFTPPPEEGSVGSLQLRGFASAAQNITRAVGPVLQTLFLPQPAEAAVLGGCCLGGATTKFSPWAAVDPESGSEVIFFNDASYGTEPWDPSGQNFFTNGTLVWPNPVTGTTAINAYPAVQVLDPDLIPQNGVEVTVSLLQASGGTAVLSGDLTKFTVSESAAGPNTAVFDDLSINQAGTFRLRFTAGSLTLDSGEFFVTTGPS